MEAVRLITVKVDTAEAAMEANRAAMVDTISLADTALAALALIILKVTASKGGMEVAAVMMPVVMAVQAATTPMATEGIRAGMEEDLEAEEAADEVVVEEGAVAAAGSEEDKRGLSKRCRWTL